MVTQIHKHSAINGFPRAYNQIFFEIKGSCINAEGKPATVDSGVLSPQVGDEEGYLILQLEDKHSCQLGWFGIAEAEYVIDIYSPSECHLAVLDGISIDELLNDFALLEGRVVLHPTRIRHRPSVVKGNTYAPRSDLNVHVSGIVLEFHLTVLLHTVLQFSLD